MKETRTNLLIALGGNLPVDGSPPQSTLAQAIAALVDDRLEILSISRFYKTPCFPAGAGPDYVNAVVSAHSDYYPQELLERLHEVEAFFSRVREQRWGMRTLDLDLLAFGEMVLPDCAEYERWRNLPAETQKEQAPEELILPHPRIQDRSFVLIPLCDVAAGWQHPVLHKTAREMRDALPRSDISSVEAL